jgi:hypothetical protein
VRKLKCLDEIIVTNNFQPGRLAQSSIFVQRFVDDVPALDASFVSADHSVNVFAHAIKQRFATNRIPLIVGKDPMGRLTVPNQSVAHDKHVMLLAEDDVRVRCSEIVSAGFRMNEFPFQYVFGRD